jgi:chromosome partitioning protein
MKTLSVLSRKGGSGKTTVSVSLAIAARQAGLKTVLADVDPLRSAAVVLAGRQDAASLLLETSATKLRAVQDACRREACDLLIVDTPPAPEGDVLRAVEISDLCLAVARPSALDIAALAETIQLVSRRRREGLIVLNQCPPQRGGVEATLTRAALEKLEFTGLPVADAKLRSRVTYQHATGQSCGVTEWDPASEAAGDVLRLLAEISDQLLRGRELSGERPRPQAEPLAIGGVPVGGATRFAAESVAFDEPWATSMLGLVGHSLGDFWNRFLDS